MESVGIFHAKTHLSELVDRASKGEIIEITRHGKPVARLTSPVSHQKLSDDEIEEIKVAFRRIRQNPANKLRREDIKPFIEEGRI